VKTLPWRLVTLRAMNSEKSKELSRNAFNRSAANYENTVAGWHSRKMKEAALDRLEQPSTVRFSMWCGPGIFLNMLAGRTEN